jgi:hypothetical protein
MYRAASVVAGDLLTAVFARVVNPARLNSEQVSEA